LGTNHCALGSFSPSPMSAKTAPDSLAELAMPGRVGVFGVGGSGDDGPPPFAPPATAPAPAPALEALLMLLALRCDLGSFGFVLAPRAARTACSADILCARLRTRSRRKEAP
jgi:hypothetical protein